jgi:hypothetical protein
VPDTAVPVPPTDTPLPDTATPTETPLPDTETPTATTLPDTETPTETAAPTETPLPDTATPEPINPIGPAMPTVLPTAGPGPVPTPIQLLPPVAAPAPEQSAGGGLFDEITDRLLRQLLNFP